MIELKPVCVSDAQLVFDSWGRYPQNFARLTARVFLDVGDAERYLSSLLSAPASIALHIVEPEGAVIGIVKAMVAEHRAQVGYVVHEPFRGRGFATRAVEALVERLEADPGIARIWATCALDNPASTRVLEKCGFQREGVLRNWVVYPALGDQATDNYSYVKPAQVVVTPSSTRNLMPQECEIVEADLGCAEHQRDVRALTAAYALDPMGNAERYPRKCWNG